jgi:hypothetical protein
MLEPLELEIPVTAVWMCDKSFYHTLPPLERLRGALVQAHSRCPPRNVCNALEVDPITCWREQVSSPFFCSSVKAGRVANRTAHTQRHRALQKDISPLLSE